MSNYLYQGQVPLRATLGVFIFALSVLTSCWSKDGGTEKRDSSAASQAPSTALTTPQGGQPVEALPKQDGGDRLPVVMDPNSPGSCAVVNKDEVCGQCCSDVFTEDSDPWHLCMDACVKADALRSER